jgi:hypothetical protein
MDSKELRNLHEAYMDVYAPQENIEEGLRSAVKRLLGGGKKEAEAPKPESRGEQLRKKYNVGPEKSDTSAKRQILDRSRAKAEKDEKDYGDKPFQKQVAQKSKAAHDRYLKAGYSKYGADDARGRGSKATKRAAALNREEFEYIVNALVEEGYDLSLYTWDEMYDICLDEAVYGGEPKKKEDKRMIVTNADKKGNTPAYQKYKAGDKRYKSADHLGEGVRDLDSEKGTAERKERLEKKRGMKLDDHPEYKKEKSVDEAKQNARGKQRGVLTPNKKKSLNMEMEYDLFDTILEYLIAEGYADTEEAALVIMANMSEEWRESIVEGMFDFLPKSTTVIPGKYGKNTVLSKKGGVEGVSDKSKPGSFTPQKGGFDKIDAERYAMQHSNQGTSSGTSGINLAGRRETPGRVK